MRTKTRDNGTDKAPTRTKTLNGTKAGGYSARDLVAFRVRLAELRAELDEVAADGVTVLPTFDHLGNLKRLWLVRGEALSLARSFAGGDLPELRILAYSARDLAQRAEAVAKEVWWHEGRDLLRTFMPEDDG